MTTDENSVSAWLHLLGQKIEHNGNNLLNDTNITVTQLRVLKYLKRYPDAPQIADISDYFDVTHTSMIHVVNSLEKKGYVYREPIRRSRGKKIILTEAGKRLADENENRIDSIEEIMLKGFQEKEKKELVSMLKRVYCNLEQYDFHVFLRHGH